MPPTAEDPELEPLTPTAPAPPPEPPPSGTEFPPLLPCGGLTGGVFPAP